MESPKGMDGNPEASNLTFPAADADGVLNIEPTEDFPIDPLSSEIASSKALKEQAEAEKKEKENERKEKERKVKEKMDSVQKLKKGIIISGVAVAVIGAVFAIRKKLT